MVSLFVITIGQLHQTLSGFINRKKSTVAQSERLWRVPPLVVTAERDFNLCIARENRRKTVLSKNQPKTQKHLNQAKLTIVNVVGPGLPCLSLSRPDGVMCGLARSH